MTSPVATLGTVLGGSLLVAVVVLVAANLAVWRLQERMVFQPTPPPYPADGGTPAVRYAAADGQPLLAYVVGDRATARDAVLVFHGNADLAVAQLPWAAELARTLGVLVVVPEYRGYAGLGGRPTYEGSRADARAAYAVVRDTLGVAAERITLYGHSLGAAIAADLAAEHRPRALVLQSPFTSVRAMAGYLVAPRVEALWGLIARVHWDNAARVAALDAPVWVAHGTRDLVIPARMGRAVYGRARVKGELLLVEGAGHNDVAAAGGAAYRRWLAAAVGGGGAARR